jgi:uncharacterized membrane protein YkvA (DUF1232 family)
VEPLPLIAVLVLVVLVVWLFLVVLIWVNRPPLDLVLPVLPLVPEVVRLARSARADPATPRRSRIALGALLLYLLSPIDLLPDLLPGIGTVDDLVVAGVILRRVAPRIGTAALRSHWQGTDAGYEHLCRLARI